MTRQRIEHSASVTDHRSTEFRSEVPVAIVGMACVFPQAQSPEAFWSNVLDGRDCIREVPLSHWRASDYFDADPKSPDMTYSRHGAFLDPIDFAPLDFGIAPKNMEAIDTTQLLGLVVARDALEDSGYGTGGKQFDRRRASVILGVTGTLEMVIPLGARLGHPIWRKSLADCGIDPVTAEKVVDRIGEHYVAWQENSFPGLLGNVTAGRIANRLDLGGTNCVVDAACASSLAAVHLAVMELAAGRSDIVVSGGFDTFNDIFMFMCFSKTPALSKSGHAKPFDQSADGTSLGEGLGAVVLKRLDDAQRDGDRIYAVIRGVGSSSDGIGQAVYAPKAEGQVRCLMSAYQSAGVDPATVEMIEAHGTGTKVGDGIEVKALTEVFGASAQGNQGPWCAVGSVKSQIGHTKAAAGVAGLIKTAMALHHKVIPPTIKVTNPAEEFSADHSPFYVPTEPRPWPSRPEHPRRAGVSAFGFGGSNFHAVLEEFEATTDEISWSNDVDLWTIAGESLEDLKSSIESNSENATWQDLQRAAASDRFVAASRPEARWRLAIVLESSRSWPDQRRSILEGLKFASAGKIGTNNSSSGWFLGQGPVRGKLAVLFSGQGAQSVGMLRDAACRFPIVARTLEESDQAARRGPGFLVSKIYPVNLWDDAARERAAEELTRTEIAQPALAALGLGLARVLGEFGISPHALGGHSLGELTALAAVGRLAPRNVHELIDLRGQAMARAALSSERRIGPGGMTAILAPESAWIDVLQRAEFRGHIFVANRNTPSQTVVAGSVPALSNLEAVLSEKGIRSKRLQVSSAFHSPWVAEASAELARALEGMAWRQGSRPVYGNTTGMVYPERSEDAATLLAQQLAKPVDFVGMIRRMENDGCRSFLEIGPDNRLSGLIRASLADSNESEVFSFTESSSNTASKSIVDLGRILGRLWAAGFGVKLDRWMPESSTTRRKPARKTLTVPLTGANLRPAPAPLAVIQSGDIEQDSKSNETRMNKASVITSAQPSANTKSGTESDKVDASISFSLESEASKEPVKLTQPKLTRPIGSDTISTTQKDLSRMIPKEPPVETEITTRTAHSRQQALIALQRLMEQTATVHSQFLATQRQAQETVRLLLTGGSDSEPVDVPVTNGFIHKSNPDAPIFSTGSPAVPPFDLPKEIATIDSAKISGFEMPKVTPGSIPVASTVYRSDDSFQTRVTEEQDAGVFGSPVSRAPQASVKHAENSAIRTEKAEPPAAVARRTNSSAALLLEIVSEKTGYPLEMLELDQQLDADLGIDSIKRVEILSAIQERRTDLPHVRTDQFGALRTLRDVVDLLDAAGGTSTSAQSDVTVSVSATIEMPAAAGHSEVRLAMLAKLLKEIVSEKTGYPVDMLDLDLQLDTDLGIDSIKRVEILSAIQESMPEVPHIRTDQFGALMTLRDIVHALADFGPKPPDGPGSGASATTPDSESDRPAPRNVHTTNVRTSRLTVGTLKDTDSRSVYVPEADSQVWVVDDDSDFVKSLATALKARSISVTMICPDMVDRVDPPERISGLVLTTPESYDDAAFGRVLRLVRKVSQPLQKSAKSGFGFVTAITKLDGKFGLDSDTESEELPGWSTAMTSGLVKTLAWEWPDVAARVIDVDPRWAEWQPAAAAECVAEEMFAEGPVERGVSDRENGMIVTPILAPISRDSASDLASFRKSVQTGELIVVTGGARGVTAEVAAALAESVRPTLLLLGRSAEPGPEPSELAGCLTEAELIARLVKTGAHGRKPSEYVAEARRLLADRELRKNLERLKGLAKRVIYRAVDLRDARAVADAVDEASRQFGPVRGLVHGAGVLADKRVEDLSVDACAPVLETKVRGFQNLLNCVDPTKLKFVAVFSSITARVGRTGQAAYAAANEMLNKLAIHQSRQYPGCRWLSLGWGPWDGGMVTPALKKVFESEGVGLIPLESGSWTLMELLGTQKLEPGTVELLVLEGHGQPTIPSVQPSRFAKPSEALSNFPASAVKRAEEDRIVWEKDASLDEWPVLRHHVIDGMPVVPTALLTEWMIEAAMQVIPGLEFVEVRDMSVLKGIVMRGSGAERLRVCLRKVVNGNGTEVRALMVVRGVDSSSGRVVDHARAEIVLGPNSAIPEFSGDFDPNRELKHQIDPYKELLFHGPKFQGLSGPVMYDDSGFAGNLLGGSRPDEWLRTPLRSQWVVDPLVLDVVMQGVCCWPKLEGFHFSLPMGYRRLTWRSVSAEDYSGGRVFLRLRRRNEHEILADAYIFDAKDLVLGRIEEIRGVMDSRLEEAFRRTDVSGNHGVERKIP